jgi:hypothetical protein
MEGKRTKDSSFSQQRGKGKPTLLPDQNKEKERMVRREAQDLSRA